MQSEFKNLIQLLKYFEKSETCVLYLEQQRWNGNITCIHCGHGNVYRTARGYKCAEKTCRKKFSVTSGTIYENTKIDLQIWFAAMYLVTSHKKGVSSHQLARDLNITQKSAWFVLHRIREMLKEKYPVMLTGTLEIDESFVGGKNRFRHKNKRVPNSQGRASIDKTPVVGLLERDGKVVTLVVPNTEAGTLQGIMRTRVEKGATLVTDAYRSYNGLNKEYNHVVVKHDAGNYYVVDGKFHTNNIEGYWSHFKRTIVGTYHYISPKHLQRYCDESGYRYNTRKENSYDRFTFALAKCNNARITYKQLIAK